MCSNRNWSTVFYSLRNVLSADFVWGNTTVLCCPVVLHSSQLKRQAVCTGDKEPLRWLCRARQNCTAGSESPLDWAMKLLLLNWALEIEATAEWAVELCACPDVVQITKTSSVCGTFTCPHTLACTKSDFHFRWPSILPTDIPWFILSLVVLFYGVRYKIFS